MSISLLSGVIHSGPKTVYSLLGRTGSKCSPMFPVYLIGAYSPGVQILHRLFVVRAGVQTAQKMTWCGSPYQARKRRVFLPSLPGKRQLSLPLTIAPLSEDAIPRLKFSSLGSFFAPQTNFNRKRATSPLLKRTRFAVKFIYAELRGGFWG